jgi:hypothetical protein
MMASNFRPNWFEPRANRLTFRLKSDASECKIYASAGKIDLSFSCHNKVIQHTSCRPETGHPLPHQERLERKV